ncbi:MAG: hypothetical protein ABI609_13585 [Acidobacteriota bacterium]
MALGSLASCGQAKEVAADCLTIPATEKISIVKVSELTADGNLGHAYQIDVPAHVAALLAAVRAHQGSECKTVSAGNRRPQELSVAFEAYDSVPLILWIGPDWIGGVDTKADSKGALIARWRPMGKAEREAILEGLYEENGS